MTATLFGNLATSLLGLLVGFEVISKISSTLQTPMMSGANAIHGGGGGGGAIITASLADSTVGYLRTLVVAAVAAANIAFAACDVTLVVGANDVTNPIARHPGNAVSGMPILDGDHAKSVVVLKRSMSPGCAGILNPLFTDPKTGMFFADAKKGLADTILAIKQYVTA